MTDFDKESLSEEVLTEPMFRCKRYFSMANFYDQLIFLIGGLGQGDNKPCSEVFYYRMKTDEWREAPALNYARSFHSSCFLGSSLYVNGGGDLPVERLTNINSSLDPSSGSWEELHINKKRIPMYYSLMSPQ